MSSEAPSSRPPFWHVFNEEGQARTGVVETTVAPAGTERHLIARVTQAGTARLIGAFLDSTPLDMAMLFDAIDAGDMAMVERHAYLLKEQSLKVGAPDLARRLLDVIRRARAGDLEGLMCRRGVLGRECSRAFEELEKRL